MSKEFFNHKSEKWDDITDHDSNIIREVVGGFPDLSNPAILDVGAGTGVMVPFLKDKYGEKAKITELDFAEKMIKVNQRKHANLTNIEYVVGDIYDYPVPTNKYDLIVCYSVFPHFSDKKKVLKKFHKLLREAGSLIIFHSQSRQEINNMHKTAGKEVSTDRLPSAGEVVGRAVKLGYQLVKAKDDNRIYLLQFKKGESG